MTFILASDVREVIAAALMPIETQPTLAAPGGAQGGAQGGGQGGGQDGGHGGTQGGGQDGGHGGGQGGEHQPSVSATGGAVGCDQHISALGGAQGDVPEGGLRG